MADERDPRRADARSVTLAPHDQGWAGQATAEAARIATALPAVLRVEHIGSTAIPGICAKPIIDLMPIVRGANDLDACRPAMEALGYIWRGEFGIEARRYCVRDHDGRRLFHVHVFAHGSLQIASHIDFRDYLRAHAFEATAYESIKRDAARAHPFNSGAYTDHKSDWIQACQQRALRWRRP